MDNMLDRMKDSWNASARTGNRVAAVHYVENGQPVDESVYDEIFDSINTSLQLDPADRFLEVGAGSGLLLERAAHRVSTAFGTDIAADMLKLVLQLPNVQVKAMDSSHLEFPDASFDKVLCYSVFQYFPSPEYAQRVVAELVRVCRPGGTIFIGDLFNGCLREVFLREETRMLTIPQRLTRTINRLLGKQSAAYLFVSPSEICEWVNRLKCRSIIPLIQLGQKKLLLHRMYRFDVVITK